MKRTHRACYDALHSMNPAGVYIHIPFCSSRCSYCDFATGIYQSELAERYVRALIEEIRASQLSGAHVDTIYFGGGTPSLLEAAQLQKIVGTVRDCFDLHETAEITLEINPGSATAAKLLAFRELGINRASFGAQTFDDRELAKLGRSHTAADARRTFHDLRAAGIANISFDLIAGLPGQTLDGWERNVDEALALRPEHLSFYLLEVHSGTPLAQHIERGIQPAPDEDLAAVMYESMLERAVTAGYEHYEISNLCLPGFQSRHNTKYWTGEPYFGFGCSAHSYDGVSRRWSNERQVTEYVRLVERGLKPLAEEHDLTTEELRSEALFLGLRLMRGVSADLCKDYEPDLERFREAGLLEFDGDHVRLTRNGALL